MQSKYTIIQSEGCMSAGLTINGQDAYGEYKPMTQKQIEELVDYLCIKFKEELNQNTVQLTDLINCFQYGSSETETNYCEQCGDRVTETVWNL